MRNAKPIGDSRPVVFWGRMLLLSLLVLGFFCAANGMAVTILLLGRGVVSIGWFLFFIILTLGFYAIAGYLGRAMYQRVRAYRRSGASARSKKRGLVFAVSFGCLLVVLCGTIWVQGIAHFYESFMQRRHGGKWCPVCEKYAIERRTPFAESLSISIGGDGRINTEGWWYKCRACGSVFRIRGGRLVKTEEQPPPFTEDALSGESVAEQLKALAEDIERKSKSQDEAPEPRHQDKHWLHSPFGP